MMYYIGSVSADSNFLSHHGIKGQKWGLRRFQNPDGSLTAEGRQRYGKYADATEKQQWKKTSLYEKQSARNESFWDKKRKQRADKLQKAINDNETADVINKRKSALARAEKRYKKAQDVAEKYYSLPIEDQSKINRGLNRTLILGAVLGLPAGLVSTGFFAYDEYKKLGTVW